MFNPVPARRHVALSDDDAYDGGPKSDGYVDALTDAAEEARS